jgi:hypothetical protein
VISWQPYLGRKTAKKAVLSRAESRKASQMRADAGNRARQPFDPFYGVVARTVGGSRGYRAKNDRKVIGK